MAGQAPPQEEDIDDARWALVLFLDAINALSLDAHFLVEPFFAPAEAPQEAFFLLELAG